MAKQVEQITLGIDVSKDELVVYNWNTEELSTLSNDPAAIKAWLRALQGAVRIAIEPTSNYHLDFVEAGGGSGLRGLSDQPAPARPLPRSGQ